MSKQFLSTVSRKKSKRQELDDYLTYSPRSKARNFYTRFHIAEGATKLENFVARSADESVEDHAASHKEEIRNMLAEQRQ